MLLKSNHNIENKLASLSCYVDKAIYHAPMHADNVKIDFHSYNSIETECIYIHINMHIRIVTKRLLL